MKTLKYLGLFLVLALSIVSCESGEDPEKAAKLEEAGKLHDAGLALGGEIKTMIENAEALILQIQEADMDETMKEDANAHINSITAVKEDYKVWQESLVEVPGHAHTHHEGEHHHHDHSMDNASPDEIVTKQEELKDYVADIHNRATKAVEALQSIVDEL